jgi:hypothetical protein
MAGGARGSAPRRAGRAGRSRNIGRSNMQHGMALEAVAAPDLSWDEVRLLRGESKRRAKKPASGRDPFFSNAYYPNGR